MLFQNDSAGGLFSQASHVACFCHRSGKVTCGFPELGVPHHWGAHDIDYRILQGPSREPVLHAGAGDSPQMLMIPTPHNSSSCS